MIRALRMFALALVGLATSAAAAAPTTPEQQIRVHGIFAQQIDINHPPFDPVDRAKFPLEDPKEVDAVQYVNDYVNSVMTYVDDKSHYGFDDLWVQVPPDRKGDCEDFALTKMFMLVQADLADAANTRIEEVLVVHRDRKGHKETSGHAILAYRFTKGTVVYLDINYPNLMTKAELANHGYIFQDW